MSKKKCKPDFSKVAPCEASKGGIYDETEKAWVRYGFKMPCMHMHPDYGKADENCPYKSKLELGPNMCGVCGHSFDLNIDHEG